MLAGQGKSAPSSENNLPNKKLCPRITCFADCRFQSGFLQILFEFFVRSQRIPSIQGKEFIHGGQQSRTDLFGEGLFAVFLIAACPGNFRDPRLHLNVKADLPFEGDSLANIVRICLPKISIMAFQNLRYFFKIRICGRFRVDLTDRML